MKNWDIYKANIINVTGRGTVIVVDLIDNDIIKDIYYDKNPININDVVRFENNEYLVRRIESATFSSYVGLVVRMI